MATFVEMKIYLEAWRKFRGMTQEQLGHAAGTDKTQISKLEKGQRRLTADWMQRLAGALQIQPEELLRPPRAGIEPAQPANITASSEVAPAPEVPILARESMPRDVPVRGTAVCGSDGDFELNGAVIDYVRRPPSLVGKKDVFAIYAQGDSMAPWRERGDPVYIDSARPARPGEYVLVELHPEREGENGRALLKRLVSITPTKIRLAQYNPPNDRVEIKREKVRAIYRVIDWPELLGI